MYRIALLTEKTKIESAAQQIFKTLVHNATFAMLQNKKAKASAAFAIAEL